MIQHFNEALVAAMRAGKQTEFQARYAMLAPAVDQAFDLLAVLKASTGPRWTGIAPDEQARLLATFRRYTIASYVANFARYEGQTFWVVPDMRDIGGGQMIVQTSIAPVSGDSIHLGYVMSQGAAGWKIVDVLAGGSISRVAVQRSGFRGVLASGGGEALEASLQRKTSDLSNGSIA